MTQDSNEGGVPAKQEAARTLGTAARVTLALLFLLGPVITFGPATWLMVPLVGLAYLTALKVALDKIPVGTLLAGEVGTSALLTLVGATVGGLGAILAFSILGLSGGLGEALADAIQHAAKGKVITPGWVVFLSAFALVALWIAFLRGRQFTLAKREAQAAVLAHRLAPALEADPELALERAETPPTTPAES